MPPYPPIKMLAAEVEGGCLLQVILADATIISPKGEVKLLLLHSLRLSPRRPQLRFSKTIFIGVSLSGTTEASPAPPS
jgi:hypothetical protein